MEQAIFKALEGLLLPPLRQLVVEYHQLSPKRKEELAELLHSKKFTPEINAILADDQTRHEMAHFLSGWILPFSINPIPPDKEFEDIGWEAAVITALERRGCGLKASCATPSAIRAMAPFLVQHLGLNGLSLADALKLLLAPDKERPSYDGVFHDFKSSCLHGRQEPNRCSECIAPLFWYLCKLYQAFDGPQWQTVLNRLLFYGFIDLATEWVNRNLDIARAQFTGFQLFFPLSVVCKPEIVPFAKLCNSLQ